MRIVLLTAGSRGDVQPYVALGVGLQRAGHRVVMPAPPVFHDLIAEAGLEHAPSHTLSPQDFIRQPEIQAAARRGGQLRVIITLMRYAAPLIDSVLEAFWQDVQEADAVVGSTLPFGALDAAEALSRPHVWAPVHALQPTRAFPNVFFAPFGARLHSALNPWTHHIIRWTFWVLFGGALNRWRVRHGLKPLPLGGPYAAWDARRLPTVYGFSAHVLPPPDDWPAWHQVTGYWFLDAPAGWRPPDDLLRFLETGPPPVYIGFGSMDDQNPERLQRLVLEALRLTGRRAVLLSGWLGLRAEGLPPTVYHLDSVPHDWLFPRVAAVVHHGGAGTTAAGLRAGVPTVITPFAADQFFWADRLARLGVGVRGPGFFQLSAEALAAALDRALAEAEMRRRAAELGEKIRAEGGVAAAVRVIEQTLRNGV